MYYMYVVTVAQLQYTECNIQKGGTLSEQHQGKLQKLSGCRTKTHFRRMTADLHVGSLHLTRKIMKS